MTNQPKVEKTKSYTKNKEIADLVEQQVQSAVDPFVNTFSALWGSPSFTPGEKIISEFVPEQTSTNLNMDKNIHLEDDLVSNEEPCRDVQKRTMPEYVHEQKQININLDMDKSEFVPEQKQTDRNLDIASQKILSVIRESTNFSLIGFITFLNVLYPEGKGKYSINNLSRLSGMSRTSIRGNLQNLEQSSFISLTQNEICLVERCRGWTNLDNRHKNIHVQNEICMIKDMYKFGPAEIQTGGQNLVEATVSPEKSTKLDMPGSVLRSGSETNNHTTTTTEVRDGSTNSDMYEQVPPWLEKIQLREQAEELFYIAMCARVNAEVFSMQTLNLYKQISKDRGRDYAAALFLHLLPKAKDNPTGYISTACKQGAEPTSASITKAKEIWTNLDVLSKTQNLHEIKQKIQNAIIKEDTETVITLTQIQAKIKAALQLLSWSETTEMLIERRKVFIASLGL